MFGFEPLQITAYQKEYILSRYGVDLRLDRSWRSSNALIWACLACGLLWESIPGSPIESLGWFPNLLWGVSVLILLGIPVLALSYRYMRGKEPENYRKLVFTFAVRSINRSGSALICILIVITVILSAVTGGIWLSVCVALAVILNAVFHRYEMNEARRMLSEIGRSGEDPEAHCV